MTENKQPKKRKHRGRPSIAELYGETETVALKITVTAKQYEWLNAFSGDETPGEVLRSLIALAMAVEADEMPGDYNPVMWRDMRRMVRELRLDLARRRGGS